jgi:hypothetical protein
MRPRFSAATGVSVSAMLTAEPIRASDVQIDPTLPRPVAGFVYAIMAREFSRVKIGRSERSAACRLNEIVPQSPTDLELHSETWHEDHFHVEKELQDRFAHAHIHGEWFWADDPHVGLWLAERADLMRYYERFTDEMLALASESAS